MKAVKRSLGKQGMTLVEVIFVVAILGFSVVVLSGLLRAISVAGRNLPTSTSTPGRAQTYQQVVDQVNMFLIALSRDAREAKKLEVKNSPDCPDPGCSECLLIHRDEGAFITYGYWEDEKVVRREEKVMVKEVYRGESPVFRVVNGSSVTVTLPVKYLSQTKKGNDPFETRVFSFTVERRLSPSPPPSL